jgi:crotonobetainyl-CoA:carnitine CoA-transferase CaiB-like acyl-CoA transferase
MAYRRKNPEIIVGAITEFCSRHTKEELYEEGQKRHIAVTPINTVGEFMNSEQVKAREAFVDMEHERSQHKGCRARPWPRWPRRVGPPLEITPILRRAPPPKSHGTAFVEKRKPTWTGR